MAELGNTNNRTQDQKGLDKNSDEKKKKGRKNSTDHVHPILSKNGRFPTLKLV